MTVCPLATLYLQQLDRPLLGDQFAYCYVIIDSQSQENENLHRVGVAIYLTFMYIHCMMLAFQVRLNQKYTPLQHEKWVQQF